MAISLELNRLLEARNKIRTKMVALGLASGTDNLTTLADNLDKVVKQGAIQAEVKEGETYSIPAGYHDGSGSVLGVAGGGNYKLQTKTVTPSKTAQSVAPDSGNYGLSSVTVNAIPDAYQDVTSVTAVASDVLTGKIIVTSSGTATTGDMPNNGAVTKVLDTTTTSYTIPKGYHSGAGKVSLTVEAKTVAPSREQQVIKPSTGKVLSQVTIGAIPANLIDTTDADALAANILVDKTAYVNGVKIEGTMADNSAAAAVTLTPSVTKHTVPAGYHDGKQTISVSSTTKSVTPTKSVQNVSASGQYLTSVSVAAIPAEYITTTDATAAASMILDGETAYVKGTKVEGSMPNNGSTDSTIDGLTATSVSIPAGYTTGGTVSLTSDIEEALAAI